MTPEQEALLAQIPILKQRLDALLDYSTLPLELENALLARGFIKIYGLTNGFLKYNNGQVTSVLGTSRTVYVAASSGAPANQLIISTDGLITV